MNTARAMRKSGREGRIYKRKQKSVLFEDGEVRFKRQENTETEMDDGK